MKFIDKLQNSILRNHSTLFISLDPNPELLGNSVDTTDINTDLIPRLQEHLEWIIAETSHLVCAYKPTLGFYVALGIPGLMLLHKLITKIPADIPIILDLKHSDLNTSSTLAATWFSQWPVDAVTVSPFLGQDAIAPFLVYPDKAVFVMGCTSNPGARTIQDYPDSQTPLYQHIIQELKTWGTPEQLAIEVGTTSPEVMATIRRLAPERWIMARSLWSAENRWREIIAAGLNTYGDGLIVPVPQDDLSQPNLAERIDHLRQIIEELREKIDSKSKSTCAIWVADSCALDHNPHQDLILQLFDVGCIMFGTYVQASGATFPYYIDLRTIISNPQVFHQVLNAYAAILENLTFDRLAGIPYGSLPTATGLSLRLGYPMIYPRKEVKAHGTRRLIEGHFQVGETVAVVDDILISGKSAIEGAEKLKSAGLLVQDIVVLIDHEKGVKDKLLDHGYRGHSVLTISEIAETLLYNERITKTQFAAFEESHH
ncbi:MAG: bifunctional orotidine-5'-phosphate decarboxylase/orotate phosphoribosyltransferase [Synechococcales cyanobacterium]